MMQDEHRSQKESRINEAARAWKAAEIIPENEGEAEKLRNYTWEWAEKLFNPKKEEYITDTIFSCIMNFNPDKGAFCNYLSRILNRRKKGYYAKLFNEDAHEIGLSTLVSSDTDEDSLTLEDTLASDIDVEGEVDARIAFDSFIIEQTSLVLNFSHHYTGHAANESRRMWYRIFFTENMTYICKEDPSILKHPRDVFQAMNLSYLDYYMSDFCRTPKEVKWTPPKPYCDVVPNSEDPSTAWLEADFPGDVSLYYILKTTGNKPGRSARSNQLKTYRDELHGLL